MMMMVSCLASRTNVANVHRLQPRLMGGACIGGDIAVSKPAEGGNKPVGTTYTTLAHRYPPTTRILGRMVALLSAEQGRDDPDVRLLVIRLHERTGVVPPGCTWDSPWQKEAQEHVLKFSSCFDAAEHSARQTSLKTVVWWENQLSELQKKLFVCSLRPMFGDVEWCGSHGGCFGQPTFRHFCHLSSCCLVLM